MEKQTKQQAEDEFERGVSVGYMHLVMMKRIEEAEDRDAAIAAFYAEYDEEFQFTDEERAYLEGDETYGIDIS